MEPLQVSPALEGVRVIEVGDWRGEFAGRLLGNMGAEVIKVEPLGGSPSRRIGPFYEGKPGPERSLYWWQYNVGKRSVTLDLQRTEGREILGKLVEKADVLVETFGPGGLEGLGLAWEVLHKRQPGLTVLSISDFGLDGPWAHFKGEDLIAMALGGQMMVTGYPADADGGYDAPPISPQMYQSAHLAGSIGAMDVLAALAYRDSSGLGQRIDLSLHAAANSCTEMFLPWYMIGGMVTGRRPQFPEMFTGDGKYMQVMLGLNEGEWRKVVDLLDSHGMAQDLRDPRYADPVFRRGPEARAHIDEVVQTFLATQNAEEVFLEAQKLGVIWSPVRQPHESLEDEHFVSRGNFAQVEHEDIGRTVPYPGSPWVSERLPWRTGPRAPHVGEHNGVVYQEVLGLDAEEIARLRKSGLV